MQFKIIILWLLNSRIIWLYSAHIFALIIPKYRRAWLCECALFSCFRINSTYSEHSMCILDAKLENAFAVFISLRFTWWIDSQWLWWKIFMRYVQLNTKKKVKKEYKKSENRNIVAQTHSIAQKFLGFNLVNELNINKQINVYSKFIDYSESKTAICNPTSKNIGL